MYQLVYTYDLTDKKYKVRNELKYDHDNWILLSYPNNRIIKNSGKLHTT